MSPPLPPPRRPQERYGARPASPPARRRRLAVLAVVLGAVGVAYAAWFAVSTAGAVSFTTTGYEHLDEDATLRVSFSVTRPAGSVAVCEVEALSSGAAQVGLRSVTVPASPETTVVVTADVRTSERAVTGQVSSCALG